MKNDDILFRIAESFNLYANHNAFCIENKFYSYQELNQRVAAIQLQIKEKAPNENLIGLIAYDSIDTYAAILAILFLGKGYVPLHPEHPTDRNNAVVSQSGISWIVSSQISPTNIINCENLHFIHPSALPFSDSSSLLEAQSDHSIAYLLFTSGTTGIPKGVPISRTNLNAFFDGFSRLNYPLDATDRCLQMFDLTFDLSVMSYLAPLVFGACVFTVPSGNMKFASVFNLLEEYEISFALMVPSFIQFLRPYFEEVRLPRMRVSLFCGEALNDALVKEWQQCVPNALVENVYGPTEATIFCTTYTCSATANLKAYNDAVCIGKPMKQVKTIIVDENQQEVAVGEKGELCLAGAQLTRGYWNPTEKNKLAFFNKTIASEEYTFYRTGDICFVDAEGDIQYCGRLDHQVKIQGYRVELGEIEHHAREIVPQHQVAAVVKYLASNALIYLFIEAGSVENETLLRALKEKLPSYMLPSEIIQISSFPLNSNGKVDKKALLESIE
ncbi:MAG: amino acid adenylation domain-containing protein [Bacteroidota bacterium]